jgi:hypothetical protein
VLEPDSWTIKNGTFQQHDVLNKEHLQYQECKEILQQIIVDRNKGIKFSTDLVGKIK